MTTSFIFTHPDFTSVQSISWYPEASTFAVVVKFKDDTTVKDSLSSVTFQTLYSTADAARIPCIELCHLCKENCGHHRWTTDGDVIIICDDCAEVEEF